MDVLLLSGQLGSGGAPRVCLQLVRHFPPAVDVTVAYLGGRNSLAEAFEAEGVTVTRLAERPLSLSAARALNRHLATNDYDLVHTHMMSAGLIGRPIARARGLPCVHTVHTNYEMRPTKAQLPDLLTAPFGDLAVCVSRSVERSLPWYYLSETEVIHNCIDPEEIRNRGAVGWDELEWTTGLDPASPIVANVARYDPKKRRIDLIEAFQQVVKEVPDAQLVLTGRHGERQQRLSEHTKQLGIEANVFFLGFVENPQSVYHHADIIVLASEAEGFSIGMLEAMSFGKPIVATDIPAFREALGPEHEYVQTRNVNQLATCIQSYLRDVNKSEKSGQLSRARVENRFAGSTAAKHYLKKYYSVCDKHP